MKTRKPVPFDMYIPRLKKGKVQPQGRRMVFETEDDGQQIVLPIEMADVLLLANGNYNMRQIIEKMFKRKGVVHFRTLFKTIHQLKDHGFLENGEELESFNWWNTTAIFGRVWGRDLRLLGRRSLVRPRPIVYYFLSLLVICFSILCSIAIDKPPFGLETLLFKGSVGLAFALSLGILSLYLTSQTVLRIVYQLLLTGNIFGIRLRVSPVAIYLCANEEPIFLISNRLFLFIYHCSIWVSPVLVGFIVGTIFTAYIPYLLNVALLKMIVDVCPFTASALMKAVRSLLSLGNSDIVSYYLRDNSLLALLNPVGRTPLAHSIRRLFYGYSFLWAALSIWVVSKGLLAMGEMMGSDPIFAGMGWFGLSAYIVWIVFQILGQYKVRVQKEYLRAYGLLRAILGKWKTTTWNRDRILEALLGLPLFSYFSTSLLEGILEKSEVMVIRSGTPVIRQDDIGRDLFVLLEGQLAVELHSVKEGRRRISTLLPVSIFGEAAMVDDRPRSADVLAIHSATILRINTDVLRQIAVESQYVREIEAFRNAIAVNQFFTSAPMFRELSDDVAHDITMRSSLRTLPVDETIIRQGDPGRSFFMVLRGAVEVTINGQPVKKIRQGGFFGEIAIIADIPRTATVKTVEPSLIMEIAAANFWEIVCQNIELAMFIEAVGESRLQEDIEAMNLKAS